MQCHISSSLSGLDFRKKYNMTEYVDSSRPLVIFGMYDYTDLGIYLRHKSDIILVWQGMDARSLQWQDDIKLTKANHYSISHWIKQSLDNYGIESELLPISATVDDLEVCPRGEAIYFYS